MGDLFIALEFILNCFRKYNAILITDEKYIPLIKKFCNGNFIGVNPNKYTNNLVYRLDVIKNITSLTADISLNLNISRPNLISDSIAFHILACKKIGFASDFVNSGYIPSLIYNKYYTELFKSDLNLHEIKKLSIVYDYLNISISRINFKSTTSSNIIDNKYISIVLGAGKAGRIWSYSNYIDIINFLISEYDYKIYLLGTSADINDEKKILSAFDSRVLGRCGKTSLIEYVDIISNSSLVISNESSAAQIAHFFKVKAVCILGGGHFGRFVPFSSDTTVVPVYNKLPCYNCNWNCKYVSIDYSSAPCISSITSEQVLSVISDNLH